MKKLIAWWVHNRIAANLMMVAIVIAGVLAYFQLEREFFPSADFNGATVSVAWPGASPREVEEQIVLRIEEAVSGINGIKHIQSTAREGVALINIEADTRTDFTRFRNEVENRVNGVATFPRDAEPPIVSQWRTDSMVIFMAVSGEMDDRELNRFARELRDELARIPNGSPVINLWGAKREEVSIEVTEEALRQYNLTFDEVARAIRGSSLNLAGGQIRTDSGNVPLAVRSLANSETEFEQIIIRQEPDGSTIRLRDVATVIDGFEDVRERREVNGDPTISMVVSAPETLNIVELSKAVNGWIDEKNEELDGKAEIYVWFDTADVFFGSMRIVTTNAIIGLLLVLGILLLFLRPAVAFWVSIGIAVSFAGAFIFMPATGVSLNFLSLFAFLLVIGVVVDDAIIVGESIHNQVEEGHKGLEAAILGAQLVAKPVFFAVLTTMIAFLPWLFMSGGTAQFTRHITLTIIFALSFSLIEAFFLLPAHLSHMKPQNKEGFYFRLQGFFADGIISFANRVYRPIIKMAVKARYFTAALFIGTFSVAAALLAQGWVAFSFSPEVQGNFIALTVRMPEGAPFSRSLQIFDEVELAATKLKSRLGQVNGEDYVDSIYIGAEENEIISYVTIVEASKRKEPTKEVAEMFREELGDIPDAEEINIQFTQNEDGPDLVFGIEGDDLDILRLATVDLQNHLRTLPGVFDVRNNLQSATPELQIELTPGAERFGLTLAEVSRQVRQAYYGEEVQRLPRNGQDVRVMVRYPASARSSLASIEDMRIRTADGREIPLATVADAKFAPSFKRIDRRDRQRSARVTGHLRDDADRAAINKEINNEYAKIWRERHPEASLTQRGDAEEQQDFLQEFFSLYAVALFAMYMLLAIAFGSYWQPALIMTAIPFGFMGAAFGHFMFDINFTLFSFFGVGAAAGVVVNDNLVLIDYVNRLRAKGEGAYAALVTAGVGRFRPIVLTSITTFVGLLPIMFERSTDAEFLKPTVVALAFGVFFAMFVTLLFVPAMYAVGADIARFYRWCWTGVKQPNIGEGASLESDFGVANDGERSERDRLHPAE